MEGNIMNENKFSQIIKELRKKNNLTQQQLADIVGITATGVSYWESGNATPNTETLNKLSNYFGVTVNYLLGIKDKIEEEDNSRTAIIFRKAEQVDPKEKEKRSLEYADFSKQWKFEKCMDKMEEMIITCHDRK